ncbi:hypothetical protein ACS0TY_000656 [Phlomoides rotata]
MNRSPFCRMDLQIKHAVAVKVMGMTWSRGQFAQNRAFQVYHPRIFLKCSSATVYKSECFPGRVGISRALRLKSERKIYPLRSHSDVLHSFSAFRVRIPFGCELSNTGMPANVSNYGLISGLFPTYCGTIGRSFSQIPRVGTQSDIVRTEAGGSGSINPAKTLNKRWRLSNTFAVNKGNATSVEELASSSSDGKALAIDDVNLSSSDGLIVEDNKNSLVGNSKKTPKGKGKAKQTRSNKKQSEASGSSSPTEAADMANSSKNNSQSSRTKNSKSKPSQVQSNSTSGTPTEVLDKDITTESVPKKATKSSTKKGKSNTKSPTPQKLNGKRTVRSSPSQTPVVITKMKPEGKGFPQLYPPIAKSVVVVESVTKAKVIQGYLGEMYEVVPSYGHVRDLAARSGSVRPDDDFSMVWEVPSPAWTHLKSIKVALSGAENLILASDPDREGEAIAWHIIEMLQQQDALREDVTVARVVFNEITETSIKSALQAPREIDADLVHAYLARRALDYLIGFNVSPLLWRKLPGCQSAGRVQSAALALICDREREIDGFKATEYWTIDARFQDPNSGNNLAFSSHLTNFDSKKLNQLSINSNMEAKAIEEKINLSKFELIGSKTSKIRRNPPPPYITSTLQQDSANKLNFSAAYTMKVAQKLYEGVELSDGKSTGLITYMRTDGLHLSDEAAKNIQSFIVEKYGPEFAAKSARRYFKKVKNAQEAHEAIRPTDITRVPSTLVRMLDDDALKLYTLIWSRSMACQMEPSVTDQLQCDVGSPDQSIIFRSTCSRLAFLGFKAVYEDAEAVRIRNNDDDDDSHRSDVFEILSNLKHGQPLHLTKVELDEHHTQPPPRYTEGSLVKKLEELGIGRPSTYATTIKVLKDRNYVTIKNRTLFPEFRGRMVSAFLSHYFSEVTDYSFTADMEAELDNVSAGTTEWKGLLKDYWTRFSKYCESASNVHIHQVEKMLEKTFGDFLFASFRDENRTCPSCLQGQLVFKVSRLGAGYFIGCDQHPKCKYIAKTLYGEDDDDEATIERRKTNMEEPKLLGLNPGSNERVLLKSGPYGYYVQLGEDRKGHLPKRASVSQIKDVSSITLEDALDLLQYPITLGNHPDDDQPIVLKLAKGGFSIRHRRSIAPVPKNLKPGEITIEKALKLLNGKDVKRCGRPKRKVVVEEESAVAT